MTGSQPRSESVSDILRAAAGLGPDDPARSAAARAADDPGDPQVLARRVRRIVRQIESLENLVDEQAEISAVLSQVAVVSKGLRIVAVGLLTDHIRQCMDASVRSDPELLDAKLREASDAIASLVRS